MSGRMKKVVVVAVALGVLAGASSVAYAETNFIEGHMDKTGQLVQYDRVRRHTFTGPITLQVNHMPSGYLRLGLRNMNKKGGPQFTDSYQWDRPGSKSWGNILVNTRFAVQGRMKSCGGWWNLACDDYWSGEIIF